MPLYLRWVMDVNIFYIGFVCTFAGLVAGLFIGLVGGIKLYVWAQRQKAYQRRKEAITGS